MHNSAHTIDQLFLTFHWGLGLPDESYGQFNQENKNKSKKQKNNEKLHMVINISLRLSGFTDFP